MFYKNVITENEYFNESRTNKGKANKKMEINIFCVI